MLFFFFLIIINLFNFMLQVRLPENGREKGEGPIELMVKEALELVAQAL